MKKKYLCFYAKLLLFMLIDKFVNLSQKISKNYW